MDLSIIIPVYNSEKEIGRLLDSILRSHTSMEYEIILIDDGSQDESLRVCKEYEEKYDNLVVCSQRNAGPSAARNRGLEKATGKNILFCDSDDYVSNGMLNTLQEYMEEDLVIFGIDDEIWDKGKCISVQHHTPEKKVFYSKNDFLNAFYYLIENNLLYSQCTKMYQRQIIEENHIRFQEDLAMGEDVSFNLEYFSCINNATIIEDVLYHYVHLISSTSISSTYYPGYFNNVCMVYAKEKELLLKWNALTEKNIESLRCFFVGRVSSAIQNELLNDNNTSKDKRLQIKKIISSQEAVEAANKAHVNNKLYWLLKMGIKFQTTMSVYLLYITVLFIKQRVRPLVLKGGK